MPPHTPLAWLVSVLLPTYQRPKLLPRAIRSVMAQTFNDWELTIVDDSSGDRTWSVMQAWAKRDPALLNDDDAYLPPHLERRLAYFRQHAWRCSWCKNSQPRGTVISPPHDEGGAGEVKATVLFAIATLPRPPGILPRRENWIGPGVTGAFVRHPMTDPSSDDGAVTARLG